MNVEAPFDPEELRKALLGLAPQQRLAFGLSCSERLYPNYVVFTGEQGWGEPKTLRAALDLAWDALLGQAPPLDAVRHLKKHVEDAGPDTGDFGTILVSSALDAATTAGLVLKLVEADDADLAVEIASLARDTVDMYVQVIEHLDPSDPAFEKKILVHRFMQAELRRQRDDLRELASRQWTPTEARRLRAAWRDPAASSIGLSAAR
ncbi:MAG: DUF416 family protein [Deltaproteobacteria bacterium]|nr:DUF416 family protein [Deltaproteobacteria bacterium]